MSINDELAKLLGQGVQELKATMEALAKYEQEVRSGKRQLNDAYHAALKQEVNNCIESIGVLRKAVDRALG